MKPAEIKATLAALGARPNKKLGQHFLIDEAALQAVVDAGDVHPGDRILEIGPGLGVLTERLLDAGADVCAIEQDRLFLPQLEARFATRLLSVTHGDAASVHWHELIGDRPWKLISNLPYSITSLALRKALYAPRPAERVAVLIQREVAERVLAKDGKTSLLSLMVALASSSARILRRVPPGAFFPPPKVESAVLEIQPIAPTDRLARWGMEPEEIMALARVGFAHPRKQLASNLTTEQQSKAEIIKHFTKLGIPEKSRPEDLSPALWAALAKSFT